MTIFAFLTNDLLEKRLDLRKTTNARNIGERPESRDSGLSEAPGIARAGRPVREKSEEEALDLTVEDQNHAQRRDEFDADFEEAIGTHLMAGRGFALALDDVRAELPADHDGHEQATERHKDTLGDHIEEVEPAVVPAADGVTSLAQQVGGGDAVRAETVHAHET